MKTRNFIIIVVAIIAAVSIVILAQRKKTEPLKDVVLDLPVQHEWTAKERSVIDSISATTTVAEARAIIKRSGLTERILSLLNIKKARAQYYILKAGKDTLKVTDKIGNTIDGLLNKNQLLIKIITPDGKIQKFFVRCMNGMVSPINDNATYVGEEIYTLAEGEGPMNYDATYAQVWDMCTRYHLELAAFSRDKRNNQKKIKVIKSLGEFHRLSAKYPIVKINALQPGDRFRKNFDGSWDYLKK